MNVREFFGSKLAFVSVLVLEVCNAVSAVETKVITEEIVTRYVAANNGAGPLWCYGAPLMVRKDNTVYVSVIETGNDVPPLCNTRWQLWRRSAGVWAIENQAQDYRQREPCPLVCLPGTGLFLSTNPSTRPPGTRYGPCKPTILLFPTAETNTAPRRAAPAWSDQANFTDHSYRGLAADGARGELLLLNIDATSSAQYVSFRDQHAIWHAKGKITFPIRAAYPQVALRGKAAHVLAIGDIREPVERWRKLKYEKLQRDWDYVFRRLFYTFTPDVSNTAFSPPLEVDSVEETAGHITNLDLHVDTDGAAHLLYLKRPHLHAFIRDAFFPNEPMTTSLEYTVLHNGRVTERRTLVTTTFNGKNLEPSYARFHVAPEEEAPGHVAVKERLYIVAAGTISEAGEAGRFGNFIIAIKPDAVATQIFLAHPLRTFFTCTQRGGCPPTETIDLFGVADDAPNLRYASLRLNRE